MDWCHQKLEVHLNFDLLSQWLTFKLLGIPYLVGKVKFKLLFHGPKWLSGVEFFGTAPCSVLSVGPGN